MHYNSFTIENYRAIKGPLTISLSNRIIPLVGVNECGKTTILQAIYCFDYTNDSEYGGKHLTNTTNLYETTKALPPIITGHISCSKKDVLQSLNTAITYVQNIQTRMKKENKLTQETEKFNNVRINEYAKYIPQIESAKNINEIIIQRNIASKKYNSSMFDSLSEDDNDYLCKQFINRLPYILYNDDFNDRPLDRISFKESGLDDWYEIYDRVFSNTDSSYSLGKISEESTLRQQSILAHVSQYLSDTLTKAWGKFSPEKKKISIGLSINDENLNIFITEIANGSSPKFFNITDRSKGFIWYYNFIMKVMFNPKQAGTPAETVYLLDEPGSYLHEVAQSSLCKKLSEISNKEGIVLYCTHSPQLLNPKYIANNAILIVEKNKKGYITSEPIAVKNKLRSVKNSAMQPVFDALMLPEYELIKNDEKIICVEGIYDKYCIECLCTLQENYRVFPSTSASAISNNIQYFIAYHKKYIAIWDNDKEGNDKYKLAKKQFGEKESEHFVLLPNVSPKAKTRMEEMIDDVDYDTLRRCLNLNDNAKYETIISELYFKNEKIKKKIINGLSDKTKQNFEILTQMIDKHLNN